MKEYFKVADLKQVLEYASTFPVVETEVVSLGESVGRVLAEDIFSDIDLPDFSRSTMDGYAVAASSTFGASTGTPAFLMIKGSVAMGTEPDFSIKAGEAARIATGGMLPEGADSVVMIEFSEAIDETAIEVTKSVAPGQHVVEKGEDFEKGKKVLIKGLKIRPQETGLMAAFGVLTVKVYKRPVVGIISTGDEIVPVDVFPPAGHIRDINTHSLSALVKTAGGLPLTFAIVKDDFGSLKSVCEEAFQKADMVLISGGSSVGTRDFTVDVLSALPDAEILVHGISISPGKPTILASVDGKAFWGLPGHVVSAMIVYEIVVKKFIRRISGLISEKEENFRQEAVLTRNLSSAQGREEFIRVKLYSENGQNYAEPVLGKSGMINTMILADGLIRIPLNTEGLEKGALVKVRII